MSLRPPHRFHYPGRLSQSAGEIVLLSPSESHHLADVLRLGQGDRLVLFDESGIAFYAEVVSPDSRQTTVLLTESIVLEPPSGKSVHLAVAILKRRAMDWMIEKLSEVGVESFQPLLTRRCIALNDIKPEEPPPQRWERLALAAAKQCGRNRPLQILPPLKLEQWIAVRQPASCAAYADGSPGSRPISHWLDEIGGIAANQSVCVAIGPEGGWTTEEQNLFIHHQFISVSLGPLILRAETAAIAAAAVCLMFQHSSR